MIFSIVGALLTLSVVWAASVTCPNTGTFTDDPPFDDFPLPYCEDLVQPVYDMFTRSNPAVGESMDRNTIPSVFDPAKTTYFIAHGWETENNATWIQNMRDSFLSREDANVVMVGWDGPYGSQNIHYRESASTTRVVGADLGDAINNLIQNAGGSKSRMWCAGSSLGAHVCGFTGRRRFQLNRITGLDPAGPMFASNPDRQVGLWTDCADFVDTINTNDALGSTPLAVGHQNFFVNGGRSQPGCLGDNCSHGRAKLYMEQSIIADCFVVRDICSNSTDIPASCSPCDGDFCGYMGYAASPDNLPGDFYLTTDATEPYCQG